jgi:hypothetical protein
MMLALGIVFMMAAAYRVGRMVEARKSLRALEPLEKQIRQLLDLTNRRP